jgi:hypothetical protein
MKTLKLTIMAAIISASAVQAQNKKTISVESVINAPASEVWEAISKNEEWSQWNPFIIKSSGKLEVNGKLVNTLIMDQKEYTFKPKVIEYTEGKSFTWKGRLIMPGIFDGTHGFEVIKINEETSKLVQFEKFSGILSGWFMKNHKESTLQNFTNLNNALKQHVENKMTIANN